MKRSGTRKSIGLLALACLPAFSAFACLWDDDTLRAEAKGLPGVVEIITGRFERNPPLYFEMRLERCAREVEANPRDFDAYDNAAVACDRLGRGDEAIDWMKRKKDSMDAAGPENPSLAEHRYRYFANLGTFHAHRWFANGANRGDMSDLQRGIELIQSAIDLNPDAHFGRERYQLLAMKWALQPPMDRVKDNGELFELPSIFVADERYRTLIDTHGQRIAGNLKDAGMHDAVKGLTGLIALGTAWQNVDVFLALAIALSDQGDSSMARLAELRCRELIKSGKRSAHPSSPGGDELAELISVRGFIARDTADIDSFYASARSAADSWHDDRERFMLERLQAGRHPDTDPNFWDGYVEEPAPAVPNGVFGISRSVVMEVWAPVCGLGAIGLLLGLAAIKVVRRSRRLKDARLPSAE